MKDEPQLTDEQKKENDKGKEDLYEVVFKYEINHLDWKSIKEGESEEVFEKYRKGLGIFIALSNKASSVSGVFRVSLDNMDEDN